MRFNARFTPELRHCADSGRRLPARKPAINHEACAFTENKRYRAKPPRAAVVVNQNADSVYQTD